MNTENKGWLVTLVEVIPELPGIVLLIIGLFVRYWAIKGKSWMYDTGGPGVFNNITWIKNTFGETIAQWFNLFIAWGIIVVGLALIVLGVWLRISSMTTK